MYQSRPSNSRMKWDENVLVLHRNVSIQHYKFSVYQSHRHARNAPAATVKALTWCGEGPQVYWLKPIERKGPDFSGLQDFWKGYSLSYCFHERRSCGSFIFREMAAAWHHVTWRDKSCAFTSPHYATLYDAAWLADAASGDIRKTLIMSHQLPVELFICYIRAAL